MKEYKEFSLILKDCRMARNISQTELAQKTGLQPSAISHFEANSRKPSFDNLRKLADCLDVTTDYLLDREIQPNQSDLIFRYSQNLSKVDKRFAENFMRELANKNNTTGSKQ